MNTRLLPRRLSAALGGTFIALGVMTTCAVAPAAQATPHTLPVTVAEVGTGCAISDASLSWGMIERWRAYITGTIANGDWTLEDGVQYETPEFLWSAGSGQLADDGTGQIAFNGGVHYSGHEELLQLDVAQPTLEFTSPTEAYLLLDLASTKPTGEPDVTLPQVRAVKIELAGSITADGEVLEITEASGRLTAEGASAFGGFYAAGEAVDPLSMRASAPGCVLDFATADAPADGNAAAEEVTTLDAQQSPTVQEPEVPWLPILVGAAALIVIAGASVVLIRSGRKPVRGASKDAAHDARATGDSGVNDAPTDINA